MKEKILFVDDEENLLAAIKRQLKNEYNIYTAAGSMQALDMIKQEGPFAVIVADMRMPMMNGIHFLSIVKERANDSVRIMLTGNADQNTAIEAINRGNIFRFLTKPCQREELVSVLEDALKQHRLITSERILLEKTLIGSVNVMTEILGMVSPTAFSRSVQIRTVTKHICTILQKENRLENAWQVELAAMLSSIGSVTIPQAIMEKIYTGEHLNTQEQEMLNKHPQIGAKLIRSIPRLEFVAQIIENQQKKYFEYQEVKSVQVKNIELGAQVLKVSIDYCQLIGTGLAHEEALKTLKSRESEYNPYILSILVRQAPETGEWVIRKIKIAELEVGLILNEDIFSKGNMLLMSQGTKVTPLLMDLLFNYDNSIGVLQPFGVRVPDYLAAKFIN